MADTPNTKEVVIGRDDLYVIVVDALVSDFQVTHYEGQRMAQAVIDRLDRAGRCHESQAP